MDVLDTCVTDPESAMSSGNVSARPAVTPGESRIPIPQSPGLMRRSASFRLRGEKIDRPRSLYCSPITENGTVRFDPFISPQPNRHRSLQSLNFSPSSRRSSGSYPLTPTPSPEDHSLLRFSKDDDLDSVKSFGSACSTMSCDHAYFARNGTTFSGRRMKYVVHCSSHSGTGDDYLTPTQRYNKQIRQLRTLLTQAQKDLKLKDIEIIQLTKEVVELRVYKASLNLSQDKTDSADLDDLNLNSDHVSENDESPQNILTNESNEYDQNTELHVLKPESPDSEGIEKSNASDIPSSLADSGHFEELHLTRSLDYQNINLLQDVSSQVEDREGERTRIVNMYEKRLEELQRNHVDECQELKERYNDKVETLLQRLSDGNDSYFKLREEYDTAQQKIRELQTEVESLKNTVEEQEERHKNMYLKMYMKGQEAARFEHADHVLEFAHRAPNRVSVPELLQQLQITECELENIKDEEYIQRNKSNQCFLSAKEAVSLWLLATRKAMYRRIVESHTRKGDLDPEITLQFLKSAIYYFLTDKENHQGHLNAIESILGYSDSEKLNIEKVYRATLKK